MSKISIIRPIEWANQKKNSNVYIDGNKAGRVGINKTAQFDVSPGKHKVLLRNNWLGGSKSVEVDLSRHEEKTIKMTSLKYGFLVPLVVAFFVDIIYSFMKVYFNWENSFLLNLIPVLLISGLILIPLLRHYFLKLEVVDRATKELNTLR